MAQATTGSTPAGAPTSSLSGTRILILGASSGIGLATAKAAAAEGASVVIVSSNQQRIDQALKKLPSGSKGFAVNLSDEKNIRSFFDTIGNFDHLVYCAGENLSLAPIADTDIDQARQFFTVRFWGAYTTVKYAATRINPGGSIGLMGGNAGLRPDKGWTVASSICGAMEGLNRALAVELAPIRVNLVAPGVIRTGLWDGMPAADRETYFTALAGKLPVHRIGAPEDIAQAYIYLMKQGYCTGQQLVVDGGHILV
jgi:NAD(P)-dependent dehydrogenase (short-subunit alcohol dehydrogenase family)